MKGGTFRNRFIVDVIQDHPNVPLQVHVFPEGYDWDVHHSYYFDETAQALVELLNQSFSFPTDERMRDVEPDDDDHLQG